MSNTLSAVDMVDVQTQLKKMNEYLIQANSIRQESTYVTIYDARDKLNIAKGIYQALGGVGLLMNSKMVYEDITRTEDKIKYIMEEKRRKQLPSWKH